MSDEQKSNLKEQQLQPSGGSDGVSLHINSETASKLQLDPSTEVTVELISEDGKPRVQLSNLPTGFTESDLLQFADERDLSLTSSNSETIKGDKEPEFWGYTFKTEQGTRVSVEERTHINNQLCNNVFVETSRYRIETLDDYIKARDICSSHEDIFLGISDSEGIWQRLTSSVEHETVDNPSNETMESLMEKTEWVGFSLNFVGSSLYLTLDELDGVLEGIETAKNNAFK